MSWTPRTPATAGGSAAASAILTCPSDWEQDDFVLLTVYTESNTDVLPDVNGTTLIDETIRTNTTPDIRQETFWATYDERASYTADPSGTPWLTVVGMAWGHSSGNAVDVSPIDTFDEANGSSTTPGVSAGINVANNDTLLICASSNFSGNRYTAGASGMAEGPDFNSSTIYYKTVNSGATGSITLTISSAQWVAQLIAVKPPSGGGTFTGTAAISLPVITAAGSGTFTAPTYTGTAAITLPVMTAAGVGAHSEHGTAAISLPVMTASGTGTHTAPTYTGDAAVTLPALTAEGTGTFTVPTYDATAAVNLPALTADGTGTHTAPTYTGTAAISLPVLTASGTGTFSSEYLGAGAATLPVVTASGTGTFTAPTYTGSATITLPVITADGTGIFGAAVYSGTADITLPDLTAAGSGTFTAPTYTGTGAPTLPVLTVAGTGAFTAPVYTGAGAATLPVLVGAGSGAFTEDGFDAITNPSGAWGADQAGAWSGGQGGAWSGNRKGSWG